MKPRIILLVGTIAFLIYAYPGLMTKDSFDQLAEARSGILYDAHPPMMQAIWRLLDTFIPGPFGMILLQISLFVVGLNMILRRVMSPKAAAWSTLAILWFPSVGAVMAVVWKDCQMAGFLLAGTGLLLSEDRRVRIAGLVLLSFATAVRYNAFAATLPLVVLLFDKRKLVGVGAWLAVTLVAFGANKLVTDRHTYLWHSSLAVQDIVGTLHYSPNGVSDTSLRRALNGTPLVVTTNIQQWTKDHYKPDSLLDVVMGPQRMFDLSLEQSAPPEQRAAIEQAWKTIVKGRPLAYLRHRLQVFAATIGLVGDSWNNKLIVTHDYQDPVALKAAEIPAGYSTSQDAIGEIYEATSETFFFRPWLYLVLAIVALVRGRRNLLTIACIASGIVIESSLFFIGPSADYRYSHWLVVMTIVGIVIVVAEGYRRGRDIGRGGSESCAS